MCFVGSKGLFKRIIIYFSSSLYLNMEKQRFLASFSKFIITIHKNSILLQEFRQTLTSRNTQKPDFMKNVAGRKQSILLCAHKQEDVIHWCYIK